MVTRPTPPDEAVTVTVAAGEAEAADPAGAVEAAAELLGDLVQREVPLGPRTTYRVGGRARLFVELASEDDLARVAEAVASSGVPVLVIGKGSNLLVADDGFDGLAVGLGDAFARVQLDVDGADPGAAAGVDGEVDGDAARGGGGGGGTIVRAWGAASLPVVARQTVRAGLTGFEWAVGVPGSIGGAVRMNAGGHGSEMVEVLTRARLVDLRRGEDRVVPVDGLELGYRRSAVRPDEVVVWADLALRPGDRAAGERTLSEIVAWRRANQPGGQNAGSVFTNPPGDSAGRLIDAAGCKGLRVGSAEVSTKHANFFQADAGGSSGDVWALMQEVRRRVHEASGVWLHPETRLVGFPPLDRTGEPAGSPDHGRPDPLGLPDPDGPPDPPDPAGGHDG
jgi:UDP-N-acetylmuramate dehydrogenase